MRKKLTAFFLSILLLPCFVLSASGQVFSYVSDGAGLLLEEEITALEEKAAELALLYEIDPVILTTDSLEGKSAQDYADDYYDYTGYREDGVLFLLAMEERDWYISTSGSLKYVLTDYGIQQLGESTLPYLSEESWYDGFCLYLDALPHYLDAYKNGAPIDGFADYSGDYYHGDQEEVVYYEEEFTPSFLISLFCGILAAGITLIIMRFSMNTKRPQRGASEYIKKGTWKLYQRNDTFLYSNVTKTRRKEDNESHGGGSSVHTSSSGRSHGGGGGKF